MDMKKILLGCAAVLLCTALSAQQLDDPAKTNKRGVPILPEAGDYGLGLNAAPFLNYLGSFFNFNTGFSPANGGALAVDFINTDQTIFGKYFLTDTKVIRGSVRLGYSTMTMNNEVLSMEPGLYNFVEDRRTSINSNFVVSGGLEWRRGRGRVQGYYGAEAFVGMSSSAVEFEYGNALTIDNPSVNYTTNFNTGAQTRGGDRIVEERSGTGWAFGARAFVGVEYFFAPTISIAGEFGWGPAFFIQGEGSVLRERIVNNELEVRELPGRSRSEFSLDNDNLNGSIALLFYF